MQELTGCQTTYRLVLEYDGSGFCGWQLQPSVRTVQGELEAAVLKLFGEEIRVHAAGRTDSGVHATGQVVHFRAKSYRAVNVVFQALNAFLPDDIRIKSVTLADSRFHARFSARWRGYQYRIAQEPLCIGRQYCWYYHGTLNLESMRRAARSLIGEFSFRAFSHESPGELHYLSRVYRADWINKGPFLEFHIEANRFLHGMVRFLVGTFINVGRGKTDPGQLTTLLKGDALKPVGPKVPACGLTLATVGYRAWPLT